MIPAPTTAGVLPGRQSWPCSYRVPEDELREPAASADLDVVGHVLPGRDVRQLLVHLTHDVQHGSHMRRLVDLRKDDLVDAHVAELRDRQLHARLAGRAG